jgi:hypothetical protein
MKSAARLTPAHSEKRAQYLSIEKMRKRVAFQYNNLGTQYGVCRLRSKQCGVTWRCYQM